MTGSALPYRCLPMSTSALDFPRVHLPFATFRVTQSAPYRHPEPQARDPSASLRVTNGAQKTKETALKRQYERAMGT